MSNEPTNFLGPHGVAVGILAICILLALIVSAVRDWRRSRIAALRDDASLEPLSEKQLFYTDADNETAHEGFAMPNPPPYECTNFQKIFDNVMREKDSLEQLQPSGYAIIHDRNRNGYGDPYHGLPIGLSSNGGFDSSSYSALEYGASGTATAYGPSQANSTHTICEPDAEAHPKHWLPSYSPTVGHDGEVATRMVDYQMQLLLLERQNKRRLLMARENEKNVPLPLTTLEDAMNQDAPDTMPIPRKAKDPSRPRRKKARLACFACQRAHLTCDDEKPCLRCVRRGLQDMCHGGTRKNVKYVNDAPPEAVLANNHRHLDGAYSIPPPSPSPPMVAMSPPLQDCRSHYSDPMYTGLWTGPIMHHRHPDQESGTLPDPFASPLPSPSPPPPSEELHHSMSHFAPTSPLLTDTFEGHFGLRYDAD